MPSTLEREGPTVIATLVRFLAGEGLDGSYPQGVQPIPDLDDDMAGWPLEAWDGYKG